MANDSIIFKGNTDTYGQIDASITLGDISFIDVYINKNGFIQGHSEVAVTSYGYDLVLVGYEFDDGNGNGILEVGELADIYPVFKNIGNPTSSYNGTVNTYNSENCQIIYPEFVIPELETGYTTSISTPIMVRVNSKDSDHIKLNIVDQTEEWSFSFAVPVIKPQLDIVFGPDDIVPNSYFIPEFTYQNYSPGLIENVALTFINPNDLMGCSVIDSTVYFDIEPFTSQTVILDDHSCLIADSISTGSDLILNVVIYQDTVTIYQNDHTISIDPHTSTNALSPTWYGYWAYDNTDANYTQMPSFNWVELDPGYNGSGGTEYKLDDDDHVNVHLPFEFQYFGRTYDEITISSNGWVSFELCDIDYFYNYTIPMALGPKAILAPFWDDM